MDGRRIIITQKAPRARPRASGNVPERGQRQQEITMKCSTGFLWWKQKYPEHSTVSFNKSYCEDGILNLYRHHTYSITICARCGYTISREHINTSDWQESFTWWGK